MLMLGAIFGFAGGVIRATFGLLKKPPKKKISWKKLVITLLSSGVIGLFTSIFSPEDIRISLLAGYGGTDFIEGLWKLRMKKIKF